MSPDSSPSIPPNPEPSKLSSEESPKDISSISSPKDTEEHSPRAQEPTDAENSESAASTSNSATPLSAASSSTPWQAIYSPQFNAYYFFNSETNETTWENPLVKDETPLDPASASSLVAPAEEKDSSSLPHNALQAAAIAQGIDPSLAYLDPSLVEPIPGSSSVAYGATAKFNARTGQFTRVDARDPTHLSEYERAKRMSEFYFDVNAWEQQKAQDQEEAAAEGNEKKRKRPSKKDLERFKEQKKQKKIAKTAWLRT
ncbi:hypothetical protein BDP27DRAFT_1206603 [Rhodocollybia butyracea]|uniref:WW domain-containing protein n=1 Tax=Rhodocollybia butyracea TaxID=206335 RepID=A0A9P5UFT5_9AGAR|nr:hypothetical protein BDP27DRAFT_1206603 [Rhodocollybia butyracea]